MTTGLYQYVREQAHRNDLVGELGRWMVENMGKRPDHESRAFQLAAKEYEGCGNWTKQAQLEWVNQNKELSEILKIEPRLSSVISEAIQTKASQGYSFAMKYSELKLKILNLVGYKAEKREVATDRAYDVVIDTISRLIPPDISNAYNGEEFEYYQLDL